MALPLKNFQGMINGKTASDFIKDLDYSLSSAERVKEVEKLLEAGGEEFFTSYIDEYYKVNVNKEDFLSLDTNVSKVLEKLADYLMFDEENKSFYKKTKYIFINERQEKYKQNREMSLNLHIHPPVLEWNDFNKYDTAMYFFNSLNRNYKIPKIQKITKFDKDNIDVVAQYDVALENLKTMKSNYKKDKDKDFYKIINQASSIKEDMVYCKNMILGTIWFNNIGAESSYKDFNLFSFTNKEHIRALLMMTEQDMTTDVGLLMYDLEQILKRVRLSEKDGLILSYFREHGGNFKIIAEKLEVSPQDIDNTLRRIIKRIIKAYRILFEDWVFTYLVKGEYKKCSKCGENKLVSQYYKEHLNADGLRNDCIDCKIKSVVGKRG